MKYPSPKSVLYDLATTGPSSIRQEALRLLGLEVPATWGVITRRTRKALLRRLACNKRKAAKSRLACVKEVLWGLTLEQQSELERIANEHRRKRTGQ